MLWIKLFSLNIACGFAALLSKVVVLPNTAQLRAKLLYILNLGLYSKRGEGDLEQVPLQGALNCLLE